MRRRGRATRAWNEHWPKVMYWEADLRSANLYVGTPGGGEWTKWDSVQIQSRKFGAVLAKWEESRFRHVLESMSEDFASTQNVIDLRKYGKERRHA